MGTNFYWANKQNLDIDDIHIHIGKRSAAGPYCYNCGSIFHEHSSELHHGGRGFFKSLDACPGCGKSKEKREPSTSTALVELGFNKSKHVNKKGISSCSSFTWTLMKHKWKLQKLAEKNDPKKVVRDEYGRTYTAKEFLEEELSSVTVEYQSPTEFS